MANEEERMLFNIGPNPHTRRELIEALESFFYRVADLHDRDSHGGYFCLADGATGTPLFITGIGKVHPEKIARYFNFAQEKARRLASHLEHVSSAQSRDPEKELYAGAIRAGRYILSFSGLPEALDEAVVLTVAVKAGLLSKLEALNIAMQWKEHRFDEVYSLAA